MLASTSAPDPFADYSRLHFAFLAVLPRVDVHARICFRDVRCWQRREDAIAETVALCWAWFVRLMRQGKEPQDFLAALVRYAARHVRSGRRLCGKEKVQDVLSPLTQRRHGFVVSPLPDRSSLKGNIFDEALQDNTQTEIPEQVAFRCDFSAWLTTRTERDRRLIDDLAAGEGTLDAARKHALSPGRVSQLRREYCADWSRFCDDPNGP